MARKTGQKGRLYVDLTGSGSAQPVAYLNKLSFSSAFDTFDATAFEDGNKVKFAGKDDASGTFSGFWDDATVQTYTASTDSAARKFYLYPDNSTPGTYWWGTAFFDFNIDIPVDGMITISGKFDAASDVTRIG